MPDDAVPLLPYAQRRTHGRLIIDGSGDHLVIRMRPAYWRMAALIVIGLVCGLAAVQIRLSASRYLTEGQMVAQFILGCLATGCILRGLGGLFSKQQIALSPRRISIFVHRQQVDFLREDVIAVDVRQSSRSGLPFYHPSLTIAWRSGGVYAYLWRTYLEMGLAVEALREALGLPTDPLGVSRVPPPPRGIRGHVQVTAAGSLVHLRSARSQLYSFLTGTFIAASIPTLVVVTGLFPLPLVRVIITTLSLCVVWPAAVSLASRRWPALVMGIWDDELLFDEVRWAKRSRMLLPVGSLVSASVHQNERRARVGFTLQDGQALLSETSWTPAEAMWAAECLDAIVQQYRQASSDPPEQSSEPSP